MDVNKNRADDKHVLQRNMEKVMGTVQPLPSIEEAMNTTESSLFGDSETKAMKLPRVQKKDRTMILLAAFAAAALILVMLMNAANKPPVDDHGLAPGSHVASEDEVKVGVEPQVVFCPGGILMLRMGEVRFVSIGTELEDYSRFEYADLSGYTLEDVRANDILVRSSTGLESLLVGQKKPKSYIPKKGELYTEEAILAQQFNLSMLSTTLDRVNFRDQSLSEVLQYIEMVESENSIRFVMDERLKKDDGLTITITLQAGISTGQFLKIISHLTDPKVSYVTALEIVLAPEEGVVHVVSKNDLPGCHWKAKSFPLRPILNALEISSDEENQFRQFVLSLVARLDQSASISDDWMLLAKDDAAADVVLGVYMTLAKQVLRADEDFSSQDELSAEYRQVMKSLTDSMLARVHFMNEPVSNIMNFISDFSGVNLVLSQTLVENNLMLDEFQSPKGLSTLDFLQALSDRLPIFYYYKDGIILVASPQDDRSATSWDAPAIFRVEALGDDGSLERYSEDVAELLWSDSRVRKVLTTYRMDLKWLKTMAFIEQGNLLFLDLQECESGVVRSRVLNILQQYRSISFKKTQQWIQDTDRLIIPLQ